MAMMFCTLLRVLVTTVVLKAARASDVRDTPYRRNAEMDGLQLTATALFQGSARSTAQCGIQCRGQDGCRSFTFSSDQLSSCRGYGVAMMSPNVNDAEPAAGAKTFEMVIEDIDECWSDPCQNGGTCADQHNGYLCLCVPGYGGPHCQTDIDECLSNPCQNGGACTDQLNDYLCHCATGYAGLQCQTDIDECSSTPCQHGGSCTDQLNGYLCMCEPRYVGLHCEECELEDLGPTFVKYERSDLITNDLRWGFVTDVTECLNLCLNNLTNCRTLNYNRQRKACYLKDNTVITSAPDSYKSDGSIDHYQRTCD